MATVPVLYDASGQQVRLEAPPQLARPPEAALPDTTDRWRMYPSRRLTPEAIAAILETADAGDPYELIELEEEMVEKDGKIEAILKSRVSAILGLQWDIVAPKLDDLEEKDLAEEIAAFAYQALNAANVSGLVGHLMDAVGKPFAVDWIYWGKDRAGRIVPDRFQRIPTKHIRWAYNSNDLRLYVAARPGNFTGGEWGEPIPPYQTVRAIDLSRQDDPTRAGVLRTLVWPYWFKMLTIKRMAAYGERYGLPPRVLKIDDSDFDNPERYTKFRNSMRAFGEDLSAVISRNADLEIDAIASADGIAVFTDSIAYFDKWMAWKVLGHELTSQSSPGQGQLGITAAMDVRQDILEGDCRWMSENIKRDVLTPMVGWNFGWDAVNAGLVPDVQFDYELPTDLSASSAVLERVSKLFPTLEVSKQWVRDTYGIPAPVGVEEEQDDVLLPKVATPPIGAAPGAPTGEPMPLDMPDPGEPPDPASTDMPDMPADAAAIPRAFAASTAPTNPSQDPIDRLASKGVRIGTTINDSWARKLRQVLKTAQSEGLTLAQTRARVVAAYPDLDANELDRNIREQLILSRLWGRNG